MLPRPKGSRLGRDSLDEDLGSKLSTPYLDSLFSSRKQARREKRDYSLLGLRCSYGQSLIQSIIRGADKMKEKEEKINEKANRMDRCKKHTPKLTAQSYHSLAQA